MKNKTPNELKLDGIEAGEASILITLSRGKITVIHGTDKFILMEVDRVEEGSWDKIWDAIRNIQTVD